MWKNVKKVVRAGVVAAYLAFVGYVACCVWGEADRLSGLEPATRAAELTKLSESRGLLPLITSLSRDQVTVTCRVKYDNVPVGVVVKILCLTRYAGEVSGILFAFPFVLVLLRPRSV